MIVRKGQSDVGIKRQSETERERRKREGGREGRKRASRVVARFRGYSAAEDHREDYTPVAVEEQPLTDPYIAHRALLRSGKDESSAGRGGARRVSSHCVFLI